MAKEKVIEIQLKLIDTMSKSIEASIEAMNRASAAEKHLKEESERLAKEQKDLADANKKAESSFVALGKQALGIAAGYIAISSAVNALTDATRFVVGVGAEFDQTMANTRAILQPTAEDFAALSSEAQQLGKTSVFTASQAGQAFTELGKLGFDTSQILASGNDVLNLAAAANIDMAHAAETSATVLNQFGLTAGDMTMVVDTMAKAFNVSALDVDGLALSMKYVGPVAKSSNISLSETTAVLGALADNGIQAQSAGTSLRRILGELANANSKASKAIREVNPNAQTLTDKLQTLSRIGLDTTKSTELFGLEAQSAAIILANSVPKIQDYSDKLEWAEGKAKGYATAVAEIQMDSFEGDLKRAQSELEALAISMFEAFKPELRKGVEIFSERLGELAEWADENQEQMREWGKTAVGVFDLALAAANKLAGVVETIANGFSAIAPSEIDFESFDKFSSVIDGAAKAKQTIQELQKTTAKEYETGLKNIGSYATDMEKAANAVRKYTEEAAVLYVETVKERDALASSKKLRIDLTTEEEKRLEHLNKVIPAMARARREMISLGEAQKRIADERAKQLRQQGADKKGAAQEVTPASIGAPDDETAKKIQAAYAKIIEAEKSYFRSQSSRAQRRDVIAGPDVFGPQGIPETVSPGASRSVQNIEEENAAKLEAIKAYEIERANIQRQVLGESEIEKENREYKEKLDLLRQYNLDSEELEKQHAENIAAINKKSADADMAIWQARGDAMATFFGGLSAFMYATAGEDKKRMEIAQHLAVMEIIMNTAVGVMKAYAQGGVLGFLTGAGITAAGAANVARVEGLHFANGGIVPSGTGKFGDNVPVRATAGEMILNMSDQKNLFSAIKSGAIGGGGQNITYAPVYQYKVSDADKRRDYRAFTRELRAATSDSAYSRTQTAVI